MISCVCLVAGIIRIIFAKPRIYCLESEVFVPPESWRMTHEELKTIMRAQETFTEESTSFLSKTLERSATGQSTHWPPAALPGKYGVTKIVATMAQSREEAEAVIFPIVQRVLEKTGVAPKDIDFLIVNCSLFLSNAFALRHDISQIQIQ